MIYIKQTTSSQHIKHVVSCSCMLSFNLHFMQICLALWSPINFLAYKDVLNTSSPFSVFTVFICSWKCCWLELQLWGGMYRAGGKTLPMGYKEQPFARRNAVQESTAVDENQYTSTTVYIILCCLCYFLYCLH